jgi:hypothetical protein
MSLTAHNQFFGWVHSGKITRHSFGFNANITSERPFPVIVEDPTYGQVINNWNGADTGMVVSTSIFGLFASKIFADMASHDSLIKRRLYYKRLVNLFIAAGFCSALINSSNRLQGYVPNGLPKKRTQEVLKYDYTSQFASQTPWKYIFSGRARPSNE